MFDFGEIAFIDTSIQSTGGVFVYNDTEIVVFCTIDLDTPYANPLKWGFIKLDTAFNYKSIQTFDVPVLLNNSNLSYPWYADYIKVKKDNQGNFYGDLVIRKKAPLYLFYQESELNVARYNSWIWMNSNLQLQYQRTDTVWIVSPTISLDMKTGGGDMLKANDSLYITLHPDGNGGMTYTQYSALDNHIIYRQGYGLGFPNSWQSPDDLITFHSFIQLINWSNNQFLITSPADHHFWNQTKDSIDHNLGQGVIEVHNIIKTAQDTLYITQFTFTEPIIDSTYQSNYQSYNPAQIKSLDFIDKNKIYYTRTTGDLGFNASFFDSRMFISQFDSTLKLKWTKMIGELSDTDMIVVPYNILATTDGGCMAFARKKVRYFNDPYFVQFKVPEYDIVVYKLNSTGTITGIKEINFTNSQNPIIIYPNPANESITISGLTEITKFRLFDVLGKVIMEKDVSFTDTAIELNNISSGLYFYSLSNQKQVLKSGKIIVNK